MPPRLTREQPILLLLRHEQLLQVDNVLVEQQASRYRYWPPSTCSTTPVM